MRSEKQIEKRIKALEDYVATLNDRIEDLRRSNKSYLSTMQIKIQYKSNISILKWVLGK